MQQSQKEGRTRPERASSSNAQCTTWLQVAHEPAQASWPWRRFRHTLAQASCAWHPWHTHPLCSLTPRPHSKPCTPGFAPFEGRRVGFTLHSTPPQFRGCTHPSSVSSVVGPVPPDVTHTGTCSNWGTIQHAHALLSIYTSDIQNSSAEEGQCTVPRNRVWSRGGETKVGIGKWDGPRLNPRLAPTPCSSRHGRAMWGEP